LELDTIIYSDNWILYVLLFIAFVIIAIAKHIDANMFVAILRYFTQWNTSIAMQEKREYRLTSASLILISCCVFVSLSIGFTLYLHHQISLESTQNFSFKHTFGISTQIVSLILLYHFSCLWIIGKLTGETELFQILASQLFENMLWVGVIIFLIVLLWLFHFQWANILYDLFIIVTITFLIILLLKILLTCFRHKVSWYYIILYLCTLELLPLLLLNTILS